MLTLGQTIKINPYFDEWFDAVVIELENKYGECVCEYCNDGIFIKFSFINDGEEDKQVRV